MFQNQLSSLSNFQGIQLESDIAVITLDDNISHTYCSKIKWEKDNKVPIGTAQLIMPYSEEIEKYWIKYAGAVVIHANLNSNQNALDRLMISSLPISTSLNMKKFEENLQNTNTSQKKNIIKKKDSNNKIHIKNDEYNYSFIGKVYRFKQVGQTFIIYLEDLGWKFMQKVPKEFRDTYIAGQSLDNAFQAICEFMGIDFAYSIEDLSEYKFSTDGYSVEKDGKIIEDVETVLSEWFNNEEDEEEEKTEDEKMADALNDTSGTELAGLREHNQTNNQANNQLNNQLPTALNSQITNTQNNEDTQSQEQETNTPNEKIEQYQQEFDEKIKDLFIGNTLYDSNISDPVLNYDWITITPTVTTDTSTATNNQTNTDNTQNNQENNQENNQANNQTNNEATQ